MTISRRRNFLATASAIAMGATVGLLVPAPAKADCVTVGVSITCNDPIPDESFDVPFAHNLTNNGTIAVTTDTVAVFTEGFNAVNNPGTISVNPANEPISISEDSGFTVETFSKAAALSLGFNSTLNNSGIVSATNTITADISSSGSFDYTVFIAATGVATDGQNTVNNSGTISGSASHSLTVTDSGSFNVYGGAFAAGILGVGFDPVLNSTTITATASNTLSFVNSGGFTLWGPSSAAGGVNLDTFGQLVNDGTISATATTTMSFTDSGSFDVYGPAGTWAAPTAGAVGVQAFYFANIVNNGTINATATTNITLTDSGSANFSSYSNYNSNGQDINTFAAGIYVGPTILPGDPSNFFNYYTSDDSPFYYLNSGQPSADQVVNTGTINAVATSTFTLNNSSSVDVYANTIAVGILMWYPTQQFSGCSSVCQDYTGYLNGTASVTNSGTVNATATANFAVNLTDDAYGYSNVYLRSAAVGVLVGGGEGGLSTNFGIGGAEGGGVVATIVNSGAIHATANITMAITEIAATSSGNQGYFSLYGNSNAIGILASGLQIGPYYDALVLGPSVTNSGSIAATATTAIPITLGGAEGGNSVYLSGDSGSFAGGIITWPNANITNSGTVAATATTSLTATLANDSYAQIDGLSLYSRAVGISAGLSYEGFSIPCCPTVGGGENGWIAGNIVNSGTVTASALTAVNISADNTSGAYVSMSLYADATGIGGAEGANIVNSGSVSAIAASTFTSTGNVSGGSVYLSSNAYGIETDAYSTITNSGIVTAAALASFSATAGGGEISYPPYASMNAFAVGIDAHGYYGYNTINNSGTISAEANVTYTLTGFSSMEGGGEFSATAKGILAGGYNQINNDGIITALATITVNAPGVNFYGNVYAAAYGIIAWGDSNNITNNGTIGVLASVNITANVEPFTSEGYFFNHHYGVESSPARAFGIKAGYNNVVLNTGTIIVESSVTVNGTTLSGDTDPSASFGIYAKDGSIVTNQGLIATTRIGPSHWAVFLEDGCCSSYFYNQPGATTIGSLYVGEFQTAQNFGTMTFRVLPTTGSGDSEVVANFGTYDRIVVKYAGTFDTAVGGSPPGTLLITPLGAQGLYANVTRYVLFIDATNNAASFVNDQATLNSRLTGSSAFLQPSLVQSTYYGDNTNSYDLILTRVSFGTPLNTNLAGNQGNVGGGLEGAFNGASDPNSVFSNFLSKIQVLPPGAVPDAYQQLAGENGANVGALGAANAGQLLGVLFGRLGGGTPGGQSASSASFLLASAAPQLASASKHDQYAQGPAVMPSSSRTGPGRVGDVVAWVSGYGQTGSIDSEPGISGARYNVAGAMVGIEKQFTETIRAGFALGGGSSWLNLKGVDSRANGKFFQGALYGNYTMGPWYVDGAAGFAFHWLDTERNVAFPGFVDNLKGSLNASQFIGGFEGGYNMEFGRHRLTPFVGLNISVFSQDSYTESGGQAALSYQSQTTTSVRFQLGGQWRTSFMLNGTMRLDPYFRVAWAHEFGDRAATVSASFVGAPSSSFNVVGAQRDRDAALLGVGFDLAAGSRWTVFAAYNGDLTGNGSTHAGTAGLRFRW
ncbi:MAG TPA: autotransporter domain-containing protein [Croceibacterium sp.]|nr:autotransporter domain-containing protein [Croceibacterium sp.]